MSDGFDALEALESCGALQRGHFRLSSGRHSDAYVQCSRLLKDPAMALEAGRAIADMVPGPVDVVLSPALGAVLIGFTTAVALGVESIFAERVDGEMALRRGFRLEPGARVLLVEDVITTGGSIMELARLVDNARAHVSALACIVQRGPVDSGGLPLFALARVEADSYAPEECPRCAEGAPLDSPGSRY